MENMDKKRLRKKAESEVPEKKKKRSPKKPFGFIKTTRPEKNGEDVLNDDLLLAETEDKSFEYALEPKSEKDNSVVAQANAENDAPAKRKKRKKRRRRRKKSKFAWLFNTLKIFVLLILIAVIASVAWITSIIDLKFGDDLSAMNLNISSKVYYTDKDGETKQYAQFNASQNRVWVPIDKIPTNVQNAVVAIEDQRFYNHRGFDIKRTTGAAINYLFKGDSTYGGSTITQQLVKNITEDKSRNASRKIREITRAVVLETKLSKEQILELYLNTIYLSQGANGVEAAANIYFSKSVSELTLSESACIAGITQYPSEFDPIEHPEANEKKRRLVLKKMLELDYITKAEYDEAISEAIVLNVGEVKKRKIQSYFLDHLFEEVQKDLVEIKGYTSEFAANMIYNGGLRIYSTVDPDIQKIMEDYFADDANFAKLYGDVQPEAAMVISDPKTGEVKGILGGRGTKSINRGLNRATQTKRQPGSSIKPIAVYAPAIDMNLITPASVVDDSPLNVDGWKPKNAGGSFRGLVSVKAAVTNSYNIPAVRVLETLSIENSYNYMKNKLHMDSLVESRPTATINYTDKTLPSLALGGLTDGVTVLEMNGAYATFANDGMYIEPHTYTKVYDVEGKVLMENDIVENEAFTPATTQHINDMLKSVVLYGTGVGAQLPNNIDTCGKTGTTDSSKDRWFVGYTPYYVAAVWYGYDIPRPISAGGNPALHIWKGIMSKVHEDLPEKHFEVHDSVDQFLVCTRSGYAPGPGCPRATQYADKKKAKITCEGNHVYIGTKAYASANSKNNQNEEQTGGTIARDNNNAEIKPAGGVLKKPQVDGGISSRPQTGGGNATSGGGTSSAGSIDQSKVTTGGSSGGTGTVTGTPSEVGGTSSEVTTSGGVTTPDTGAATGGSSSGGGDTSSPAPSAPSAGTGAAETTTTD